jgi:hypothetical protein
MKPYRITRLDRRYNGNHIFKWMISTVYTTTGAGAYAQAQSTFQTWREWCWSTWGPGMERDWVSSLMHASSTPGAVWAWDTEHGNKRLYLKSDAELALFELKF